MNGIIYRIKNKINGKVYIGLTTTSLQRRWNGHKTSARKALKKETKHPLYNAMAKYGIENFEIEKIDESDNFVKLGELERQYIEEYNSADRGYGYNITRGGEHNQLDANPRTKLTVNDIQKIREIYNGCEIGPVECWNRYYKNKVSYSAFEKIYEGTTWLSIMPEVYSLENKNKHKEMCRAPGEKNGNAILTNEEVFEIRKYYVNHTLEECYKKYGDKFSSKKSFRGLIDKSYKGVPVYSKTKKKWIYGENAEKRSQTKENTLRIKNDILEIDTIDDYGKKNGTFITNAKYFDLVKSHKWSVFSNGKIYTHTKEKNVVFLHELIKNNKNGRLYYINGNYFDVREENLTNSITEYKIKKVGLNIFKEECLNPNISLRSMSKMFNMSLQSIKKFINDNGVPISKNKTRTINYL